MYNSGSIYPGACTFDRRHVAKHGIKQRDRCRWARTRLDLTRELMVGLEETQFGSYLLSLRQRSTHKNSNPLDRQTRRYVIFGDECWT